MAEGDYGATGNLLQEAVDGISSAGDIVGHTGDYKSHLQSSYMPLGHFHNVPGVGAVVDKDEQIGKPAQKGYRDGEPAAPPGSGPAPDAEMYDASYYRDGSPRLRGGADVGVPEHAEWDDHYEGTVKPDGDSVIRRHPARASDGYNDGSGKPMSGKIPTEFNEIMKVTDMTQPQINDLWDQFKKTMPVDTSDQDLLETARARMGSVNNMPPPPATVVPAPATVVPATTLPDPSDYVFPKPLEPVQPSTARTTTVLYDERSHHAMHGLMTEAPPELNKSTKQKNANNTSLSPGVLLRVIN